MIIRCNICRSLRHADRKCHYCGSYTVTVGGKRFTLNDKGQQVADVSRESLMGRALKIRGVAV